ncbi:MAG: hypothetical protein Q4G13_02200 [Moraxella sp.]|nr:hypothetical protein [Moraxella sp.]
MSFIVKNLADRITINLRFFLERTAIYLIFIYKDEMSTDPSKITAYCRQKMQKTQTFLYKNDSLMTIWQNFGEFVQGWGGIGLAKPTVD